MPLTSAGRIPRCTYRVQLHGKFTFDDLRELLPYLENLGISDLYLSPVFTASPGSEHGYDVSDYREINPELGGQGGFDRLAAAARDRDLGIVLDFVPNHMGIHGPLNLWWRDVLELGRSSPFAPFFDIQWNASSEGGRARVVTPVLGDHYGRVLEKGKLVLGYDQDFTLRIDGGMILPISPQSYRLILGPLMADATASASALAAIVEKIEALPAIEARHDMGAAKSRAAAIVGLKSELRARVNSSATLRENLEIRLREINGVASEAKSFDTLQQLIDQQHYRLARWKAGAHQLNYRRFFAIDSLVGLRVENPDVFRESHALLQQLVREGKVTGLRIDHIDGLRMPEGYLHRLQTLNAPDNPEPLYTLVEKILAHGEELPATWPVHGTTGYEFAAQLSGLFVDASAEPAFREIYQRFTGDRVDFTTAVHTNKRIIVAEMFADIVNNLGTSLSELVNADRHWQDLTRYELTNALSELLANFSTYRTYRRGPEGLSLPERYVVENACEDALRYSPRADPEAFFFVRDLLTGDYPSPDLPQDYRDRLLKWVLTFQQYTGAVMAKSVEDTTFYTSCRFIALNEVGGDPARFGGSIEAFHQENRRRLKQTPHTMIATSTHDTKLGEDVRARLYALSEMAGDWERGTTAWHAANLPHLTMIEQQAAPDALDEYRFYQILLGAWPLEADAVDEPFRARLREHFRKSVSEAKRHTSALHPNETYFTACDDFVDAVTNAGQAADFLNAFVPVAARVARLGMVNAIAQIVLKCTSPGVPDFYQGNEIWDFSLVDPDNRRPVDYARRQRLASELAARPARELLEHWRDGGLKLRVMRTLLNFRTGHAALFTDGDYRAMTLTGSFADRAVAFTRSHEASSLLVVVPRLTSQLGTPPLGVVWEDTRIVPTSVAGKWKDLFTGKTFSEQDLFLRSLFDELPFAVLESVAG